ncbi:hypothetical protein C8Q73DRAFT_796000 [Cubamyces lactineus]|nr:hypothetical protein C8Q73DRAFT_796000 [Cubamyces lactineus]
MLVNTAKLLAVDTTDKADEPTDAQCDAAYEAYRAIRVIVDKMSYERRTFFEQLHIHPDHDDAWLRRLVTVAIQTNEDYRRQVRKDLSTARQRARAWDVCGSLKRAFSRVIKSANGLRRDMSEMVQLYQRNRARFVPWQGDRLRMQLDYIRNGISICVTQEREARAKLGDLKPLLEFLVLPQHDFDMALESIPAYSPANAIKNRLASLIKCLRDLQNECMDFQRTAGQYLLQVTTTLHFDPEITLGSDKDSLVAGCQSLRREVEQQAKFQSEILATIQMEFDTAQNLPTVIQRGLHVFTISELLNALSDYASLKRDLDTIMLQQEELRESLSAASSELHAASIPSVSI